MFNRTKLRKDGPPIVLSMIVRNEAAVIDRCLDSVLPQVDRAVFVDTGSTDDTIARIKKAGKRHRKDVRFLREPWVDFSTNRNHALEAAEVLLAPNGGFVLTIDADEVLEGTLPPLDPAIPDYFVRVDYLDVTYIRRLLAQAGRGYYWEGPVHEMLMAPPQLANLPVSIVPGVTVLPRADGARARDPQRYLKDAELLEAAAPTPRNLYYLGRSYFDGGDFQKAHQAFLRRWSLGGQNGEEDWHTLYMIARTQEALEKPRADVAEHYRVAYDARPGRPEPLVKLAYLYRRAEMHGMATAYALMALQMKGSTDTLFVEKTRWQVLHILSVSAWHAGNRSLGAEAYAALVKEREYPESLAASIADNGKFYAKQ